MSEESWEGAQTGLARRSVLRAGGALGLGLAITMGAGIARSPLEEAAADPRRTTKLNILFIGAHPDDESGTLAALGQWRERLGVTSGVITVTRGEGGGNAVGLEEGPPLGLLREAEERRAVGIAHVQDVFNLDGLDFYYTASAPLSHSVWGGEEVLERIVRVVRATRPEIIVTMNPSAVEGNHGNHQQAAMFAVEAYLAAGDSRRFPEQLREGLKPWAPLRLMRSGGTGKGITGPGAVAAGYVPSVASDLVFGCWNGTVSTSGKRWSELMVQAQREYVSQGWAEFADPPSDPAKIPATWFTVLLSRGPLADPKTSDDAALLGACLQERRGLPLGSQVEVWPQRHAAVVGERLPVTVTLAAPAKGNLGAGVVTLTAGEGWSVSPAQRTGKLRHGDTTRLTFWVQPPSTATPGENVMVQATLEAGGLKGRGLAAVRAAGAVEATIEPLEEIAAFRAWTRKLNVQHLDALVPELFAIPSGRERQVKLRVSNLSSATASGTVSLSLPAGFSASPATQSFSGLAGNASAVLTCAVANTDASIPVANRAPNGGVWPVTVSAKVGSRSVDRKVVMNLVPSTVVPSLGATPSIDGVFSEAKYPGDRLDLGAVWDGAAVPPADVSGSAWISRAGENFLVFVRVVDDVRGTILPVADNKRQRRTDSIEIYIDPRGTAANTAHTLIAGIMPSMGSMTGAPGVGRDRDNWQGEAAVTAPGMQVKVVMAGTEEAYRGYDVEALIPFSVLPNNVDPTRMGFNVVINDSDTQNKAAQTRTGWSTYPGMRADPWRWGEASVPGLSDKGNQPKAPRLPETAAESAASPQSILQAAQGGVPLGGHAPLEDGVTRVQAQLKGTTLTASVDSDTGGRLRVFVWDGAAVRATSDTTARRGRTEVRLPLSALPGKGQRWQVLASMVRSERVAAGMDIVKATGGHGGR